MPSGVLQEPAMSTDAEDVEVSRTYLSTDLFTPYREFRVTLPSIGEYQAPVPPQGGKLWGGQVTEYGGVGPLPFLGRNKVRDLEVSRSHRHYASGFSKYETDIQQCHRTSLTKSDCRTNVQLLPPPFHTDITRHVRINDIWPKHHPYKTHVAKLEMFPRSDPTRTEFDVPVSSAQSRTKQELGEATVLAIDNMTRDRYRQSQYQQTFAKYNEVLRQLSQRSGSDVTAASTTVDEEDKQVVSEAIENENGNEKKEKIVGATEGAMSIDSVPTKSILTCPVHGKERHKKRVNFNDIHQVLTKDGKIQLSGVGPCWPPATSYTIDKNSQLVERSTVTSYPPAYRSSLNPELCTCKLLSAQTKPSSKDSEQELVKPVLSKNKIVPTSEIESTKSLIGQQQVVPVATKVTAEVLPPVGLSKPLAAPFMIIPDDSIVRTSLLGGIKNPLPLPPTPLSACLQPTGSRIPDRIGLRFKTEAHRRFHLVHPETVPDLRFLKNTSKKYFFFNYHASVFRG